MSAIASKVAGSIVGNTATLTTLAMLAFAANSLLCRMALGPHLVDAASFASMRMIAGAVTLGLIVLPRRRGGGRFVPDWRSSTMLFAYMAFFSFAYLSLAAGTGALLLFGAVQLTMFVVALRRGEAFSTLSWAGLILAIAGLVYLVSPGLAAPDPVGAVLMTLAGVAWGIYSLLGKGARDPLEATAANFIYAVPLVLIVSVFSTRDFHISYEGAALAVASGAVTSGLGYVIWYAALRGLKATSAATVQLSVPVIAAFGGVVFLSEDVTLRLIVASVATLGGVAIVLVRRSAPRH